MSDLLPSQLRDIDERIANSGIPSDAFEQTEIDAGWTGPDTMPGYTTFAVVHTETGYKFAVDYDSPWHDVELQEFFPGGFRVYYEPAEEAQRGRANNLAWKEVLAHCTSWLSFVRRELNLPAPTLTPELEGFSEMLEWGRKRGVGTRNKAATPSAPSDPAPTRKVPAKQLAASPDQAVAPSTATKPVDVQKVTAKQLFSFAGHLTLGSWAWLLGPLIALLAFAFGFGAQYAHVVSERRRDANEERADSLERATRALRDSLTKLRQLKQPPKSP